MPAPQTQNQFKPYECMRFVSTITQHECISKSNSCKRQKGQTVPKQGLLTDFTFELNISIRIENSTTLLCIIQKTKIFGF